MWAWGLVIALALAQQQGQQGQQGQPVPRPFPQPSGSQPTRPAQPGTPPATSPSAPAQTPATPPPVVATAPPPNPNTPPTEAQLGVTIYPGAQFLASYDAGRGQRFYLFGSTASFLDLVTYYRNVLKGNRGELIFDAPATHQFDIGRYREETMAFPPSVTIKEYKSEISDGYPNPKPGAQPARFPTVIQIVPVPPGEK